MKGGGWQKMQSERNNPSVSGSVASEGWGKSGRNLRESIHF